MSELLFIGGPADGRRIAIEPNRREVIMRSAAEHYVKPTRVAAQSVRMGPTHVYRRERLRGGDLVLDVMVSQNLDAGDLISRLVAHYNPEPER